MSFEAQDCFTGIQALLMNRPVAQALMLEELRKAVLEFTEDYPTPLLEVTGPTVQLIVYQNAYPPSYFLQTADAALDVSKVRSFFIYADPYSVPSPDTSVTNAGYNLVYSELADIEVLVNIPGRPVKWGRNNNQIYLGSMPDDSYYIYMRYQKQHPNAETVNGFADNQQIYLADTWQEILEYAAAIRVAPKVNLANKRTELHTALYGDQKFQTSGGIEGSPGLIFQRTSQKQRDQRTTTRRLRLRMSSV
jgi:hypothetical protein